MSRDPGARTMSWTRLCASFGTVAFWRTISRYSRNVPRQRLDSRMARSSLIICSKEVGSISRCSSPFAVSPPTARPGPVGLQHPADPGVPERVKRPARRRYEVGGSKRGTGFAHAIRKGSRRGIAWEVSARHGRVFHHGIARDPASSTPPPRLLPEPQMTEGPEHVKRG